MSNPLQVHEPTAVGPSASASAARAMLGEPDFRLSGPEAVIAAIPYLIGFHPQDSVVIVWLRAQRVALTQRIDVPPRASDVDSEASATVAMARSTGADAAVVIVFGDDPGGAAADDQGRSPASPGRHWRADIATAIGACLRREAVACLDVLHVFRDRWWSYLCRDGCCPGEGRVLDPQVRADVAAWLGTPGSAPAASRQAVVASLDADPQALALVQPEVERAVTALRVRLDGAPSPAGELETWRSEQIRELLPIFAGHEDEGPADFPAEAVELDPSRVGQLLVALADVRVRDALLWHLAASSDPRRCLMSLLPVLGSAAPGYVAPIATCTAIAAWLVGDGVRASSAAQRALTDDGEYVLGDLVARALAAGLAPSAWREVMGRVSLEECRTGLPGAHADPHSPAVQ